jgi:hypothetical protein
MVGGLERERGGCAYDEEENPRSSADSILCCGFEGLRARVKHFDAR